LVVYGNLERAILTLLSSPANESTKKREWVFLTPGYTRGVASIGAPGWKGVYAMSEFVPWSSAEFSIRDWKDAMAQRKIALSSLSQGGYVAGQIFVDLLRTISGELSRDSILKELTLGKRIDNSMLGRPFVFGGDIRHNPNRQTIPMKLVERNWRISHFEWISAD
jgi:branched-chain amino acid transport system substrate-binding protein